MSTTNWLVGTSLTDFTTTQIYLQQYENLCIIISLPLDSLKKSEEQTADSVKKSRTRGLSKSHKKRLRDHDAEQENLPEEEIDERPSSKRSPAADVDKRPLSRRSLDDVDQRPLSKTSSTAKNSRSPGGTRKKEEQKHKRIRSTRKVTKECWIRRCVCVCVSACVWVCVCESICRSD